MFLFYLWFVYFNCDRLCSLVVRITGCRSRGQIRFPALPDFLRSSGSGTGSTQPREYNWGATWKKEIFLFSTATRPAVGPTQPPLHWEPRSQIHVFLTSALVGGQWSASRPSCFTTEDRAPGTHWIGSWVDPRAGMDDMEKWKFLTLLGLELRLQPESSCYTNWATTADTGCP
jgi:hypothetical protein